ncbi:MAG: nitric oxide reductase, partial [Dechloromonas sp.]|nr:nitric oxide reductase [Dechloromonas sp.]
TDSHALLDEFATQPKLSRFAIERRAKELREEAQRLSQLANDVHVRHVCQQLEQLFQQEAQQKSVVGRGALLISSLDNTELDVDACVRNHADRASGHTPESGGYLAQARCERDLACLLLADLSMSTDAPISDSHRIVDVIRDSLLLFSEALTATGDRFGIYGFSSLRRQNIRPIHVRK